MFLIVKKKSTVSVCRPCFARCKKLLKNQTNAIYENGKSIKKVDVDLSDLMKVIQSQNINGHISTSLESFTKYIGK